jgi:hypothetical protein
VIRREQVERMAVSYRRGRFPTLAASLRRQFSDQLAPERVSDEELQKMIDHGLARAAAHGITDDGDLVRYVEYSLVLGPNFDEDPALPWVRRVLQRTDLTGSAKIWLLNEHMLFEPGGPR